MSENKTYRRILPLSFSVPDECVVNEIPNKTHLLAKLIPGDVSTYIYDKFHEKEYNDSYKSARFAITKKKGGWDCLRHYEILMNGCIPLFENLKECPSDTLVTYPKHLNDDAYNLYNNWSNSEEDIEKYNNLCLKYINHTKQYCTTSATAKYFLNNIKNGNSAKNILLITCNPHAHYSREFMWIGLKRHIQSLGGVAIDHPKINYLYDDHDILNNNQYYGNNCFTFPRRLTSDYHMTNDEIINKINENFWDLIIYGKVGPDECCDFPLYDIVKSKYNTDQIIFILGGDEPFKVHYTDPNEYHINMHNMYIRYAPYSDYLCTYKDRGICFVRELIM